MSASTLSPLGAIARTLTFRLSADDARALGPRHLAAGLVCTWIVGMGRWWDDPDAALLQHLGLGSVIYVFVLSAVLWLVVLPLRPVAWTYRTVLTFVAMTSPPAALYAIPVERWVERPVAGQLNLWFLVVVATWRVALLFRFLTSVPKIGIVNGVLAALLPLGAIVASLTALNLHRVVFSIMGSIAEADRSAHEDAYGVLVILTMLATVSLPVLLLAYAGAIVHAHRGASGAASGDDDGAKPPDG